MKFDSRCSTVEDVEVIKFRKIVEDTNNGCLVPIEGDMKEIPFKIRRIFYVYGIEDFQQKIRGEHAHYKTKMVLVCLKGKIKVICKDGINEKEVILDDPTKGLLINPGIWDTQIYQDNSILLAMCSTNYDSLDYIVSWEEFLKYKGINNE
jgi:hypothetical protein